jgi:hypothetical protein
VIYDESAHIPEHVRTVVQQGTINTHICVPEWLLLTTMSLRYTADHKPHEDFLQCIIIDTDSLYFEIFIL